MAKKHPFLRYLPTIIGGFILLAVISGIIYFISTKESKPEKKKHEIQAISLTKPPPPPPPPPKVEKPPEPPPEAEKINQPEPEPETEPEPLPDVADAAPAGDLGLDAEGGAGSDGFGLVGRKGGTGLLGGGGGNPYAPYGGIIKSGILDILSDKEELRHKGYTAVVKLWIEADGTVKRFELVRGSNDAEIDDLLNLMLSKYKKINEPPPAGMPQPITLRISSRI
jgi:protein TonB